MLYFESAAIYSVIVEAVAAAVEFDLWLLLLCVVLLLLGFEQVVLMEELEVAVMEVILGDFVGDEVAAHKSLG